MLPPTVEPVSYALDLVVRLDDHAFDGTVAIEVAVRAAGVTTVALHAKDLEFKGAASFAPSGEGACDIESTSTVVDKETMTVTFTFGSSLPEGRGILSIDYVGELNNQMAGFYRSEYVNVKGEKKLMASTSIATAQFWRNSRGLFEALHLYGSSRSTCAAACRAGTSRGGRRRSRARSACRLHDGALELPESMVRDHGDGTKTVSFMPSPRMSTYLLAFVVGEFDFVSALTKNGVTIRVFCPPGKPQLGRFALECAVNALDAYDDTFQIRYPLPKSDMVAIPEFAMGAMENWGYVSRAIRRNSAQFGAIILRLIRPRRPRDVPRGRPPHRRCHGVVAAASGSLRS